MPNENTTAPKLMILVGSIREGRIGLPIAEWVRAAAEAQGRFAIDFADLAEIDLPLMDEPNHPRLRRYTQESTVEWSRRVADADAYIFVTPEYNYSYAPSVKNALDHVWLEWQRKPVGQVSYGGISAGTRGVVALRPVFSAVGLVTTMANVEIAFAGGLVEEGVFSPSDQHRGVLGAQLDELVGLEEALRPLRPDVEPATLS